MPYAIYCWFLPSPWAWNLVYAASDELVMVFVIVTCRDELAFGGSDSELRRVVEVCMVLVPSRVYLDMAVGSTVVEGGSQVVVTEGLLLAHRYCLACMVSMASAPS